MASGWPRVWLGLSSHPLSFTHPACHSPLPGCCPPPRGGCPENMCLRPTPGCSQRPPLTTFTATRPVTPHQSGWHRGSERGRPGPDPKVIFDSLYFFGEAGPQGEGGVALSGELRRTHLLKSTFLGVTGKALPGGLGEDEHTVPCIPHLKIEELGSCPAGLPYRV